jgi:hypothetical protein
MTQYAYKYVWQIGTYISEKCTASIFRAEEMLVYIHQCPQCHTVENSSSITTAMRTLSLILQAYARLHDKKTKTVTI